MPCLVEAVGDLHGSAIMTPDGAIRARLYDRHLNKTAVELVSVIGHDLLFFWEKDAGNARRAERPMAFASGMTAELGRLSATVIGISGTGSITAEQAAAIRADTRADSLIAGVYGISKSQVCCIQRARRWKHI